jgi:hypothetical protein
VEAKVRRIAPTLRCGSNAILSTASPGGLARQASNRNVLFIELEQIERLRQFLNEVGATWRNVIKVTKYLTDMHDADGINVEMKKHFEDWQPAIRTLCGGTP